MDAKTELAIDIYNIKQYVKDEKICNLLFPHLVRHRHVEMDEVDGRNAFQRISKILSDDDQMNLINPLILKVFHRVEKLLLHTTGEESYFSLQYMHPFSLLQFISLIKDTQIKHVIITSDELTSGWLRTESFSWLSWMSTNSVIGDGYRDNGFNVKRYESKGHRRNICELHLIRK